MRKQINYSKRTLRFLVLAFVLVSAGCAVLTVDVDMYKGPLANEETVIAQQIKAEIIGAKPLLFTLRNTLEDAHGENPYLKKYEFMPVPPDPNKRKKEWLRNNDAIRVNAILGLYEDNPRYVRNKITLSYLDELKDLSDRFSTIQMVMKPNAEGDRLLWDKYAKHLYSTTDHVIRALQQNIDVLERESNRIKGLEDKAKEEYKRLRKADTDKDKEKFKKNQEAIREYGQKINQLNDLKESFVELKKSTKKESFKKGFDLMKRGYRELLYPDYTEPNDPHYRPYRNMYTIAKAHDNIKESYKKIKEKLDEGRELIPDLQGNCAALGRMLHTITYSQPFPKYKDPNGKPKYLTNESFERLQDADLVRAHVDFLFKDSLKDQQRREFIKRVNLIARKFIDGRVALDESFRTALELIDHVQREKRECTVITSLLTKNAIKLAVNMVKNEALRAALLNKHAPPSTVLLRKELSKILDPNMLSPDKPWKNYMIGPYKEALTNLFEENPLAISRELHDTHLSFIVGECNYPDTTQVRNKYKIKKAQRFGILLTLTEKEHNLIEKIQEYFAKLLGFRTGAGLDRGRLPEGLETLIDDYLDLARKKSANPTCQKSKELIKKETVLTEALIRFAEKVLVIANYDTLLRGNGDSNKNKKDDRKEEENKKENKKKEEEKEKKIRQYTDVLQAVGNSIIVMANELKMKASYEQKLEAGRHRENKAMKKVLSSDPNYTSYISCAPKSSKEVLDGMIALLRYEHVQKIKTSGKDSNEAKWVAEALDVLYKQRADMVYIRPASAYLRSSYPAASLQRDPSVAGWKNMLGGHAWRSVPFFGEGAANKSKSDLETLRSIDKQSWQNINHIRVAGTGDTSYVIVKDDIGNWYIKGYKGDPEPIIKGAKNMALFAASAQAGRNLIDLPESSKSKEPAPEPPQIIQLSKYKTRYKNRLQQDYNELKDVVKNLPVQINSLWDVTIPDSNLSKEELKSKILDKPKKQLLKTVNEVSKREGKNRNYMEMYMDMLTAVIEYYKDIKLRLGDPKDYRADRYKVVKIARKSITNTLSEVVTRFIERREKASGDHEMALMIIGDTEE